MEWQPIETAPKQPGVKILAWIRFAREGGCSIFAVWSGVRGCWYEYDVPVGFPIDPTHWLDLKPPGGQGTPTNSSGPFTAAPT